MKDPRMSFLIEPWSLATQEHSVNWIYIRRENREASISSLIKMLPAKFFTRVTLMLFIGWFLIGLRHFT